MAFHRLFAALLVVLICHPSAMAQTDDLRAEIDSLKKGQEEIQKQLQEIRRLLANRQQPAARGAAVPLPATIDIARQPGRGGESARVAIIEYSDYECPFCARYVKNTYPQIDKEYIRSGKVRYVFKDLPLSFHKNAFKAAEASHCAAEQGKYWEMHDRLFENQKALAAADLLQYARSLALDSPRFEDCLQSGRFAAAVRADAAEASRAGITGTPTFLIGVVQPDSQVKIVTKLVGARPYSDFKAAIDDLLGNPSAEE